MTPAGIVLTPTSVDVAAQGSGCAQLSATFTASEAGYGGNFTAVSNNTAIVTVAPANSPSLFTVTSTTTTNGGPGTTITVTDTLGHSATETVQISICLP